MFRPSIILALVLVAGPFVAAQTSATGERYNLVNQHTYVLTPQFIDWQVAREYAHSLGGYLVAINNSVEQDFIVSSYGGPLSYPSWIGLNDAASEGVFVWDSGEPVTYTNFCAGEPNNFGGNEDYVEMFSAHTGGSPCWNDNSSPYSGPGIPASRGIVELAHGVRVNFDGAGTSCQVSAFPISNGTPANPEGVSWNGAGAANNRLPNVTTIAEEGMPVTGTKYLRLVGDGMVNVTPGGLLPRPALPTLNEVRVAIPPGTQGVSLAYDFCTTEFASYNDGMDISIVDVAGNRITNLAYADALSSTFAGASTGAFCNALGGRSLVPGGPQTVSKYVPVLPYPAYLSIVCWNGDDNSFPSAVSVDAIQFWGTGKFQLEITAPFGPGSLRLKNSLGKASVPYWTAVTLSQGAFPNGWLFGLDISMSDLLSEVTLGVPFSGTLTSAGGSTYTIPSGVPPGIPVYAVSLQFASDVSASAPEFFLTL